MAIEITVLVGILTGVGGFLLSYISHRRTQHKDASEAGKAGGVVLTELGYIKGGIDDIKRKQETQDKNHLEMVARMVAVEASTKQAHKRIDAITGDKRPGA